MDMKQLRSFLYMIRQELKWGFHIKHTRPSRYDTQLQATILLLFVQSIFRDTVDKGSRLSMLIFLCAEETVMSSS